MLTDHMLNNLQDNTKKFSFNASSLAMAAAAAKNFTTDYAPDYEASRVSSIVKNERLSPPNLKTEIEIEPHASTFSR